MLTIHTEIYDTLRIFYENKKIPNILFHGPYGSGKRTMVEWFIQTIYQNNTRNLQYVLRVNCSHGIGIKYIRDTVKFFAKTNIQFDNDIYFKSVIIYNADDLTPDAQSAMRKIIEDFSNTTRFFIIAENKYNLMSPILSRFCELYIPEPMVDGVPVNLYSYNIKQTFPTVAPTAPDWLLKTMNALFVSLRASPNHDYKLIHSVCNKLYDRGYSCIDLLGYIQDTVECDRKYEIMVCFDEIKKEIRNETLIMFMVIFFTAYDTKIQLREFQLEI